ncbi:hypothetical protein MSPP1_002273 [Malassezia sp. CBS 17886]|nr:hypothetical protein MSPP1_002273 [Malassezia sp. CBS 17886]
MSGIRGLVCVRSAAGAVGRHARLVPPPVRAFGTTPVVRAEADSPAAKKDKIVSILTEKFQPNELQVEDISGGCGSFFAIMIKSQAFEGRKTIQAHRMVNQEIKDVIEGIHGLQVGLCCIVC